MPDKEESPEARLNALSDAVAQYGEKSTQAKEAWWKFVAPEKKEDPPAESPDSK